MEMAENPKLDLASCRCKAGGLEENMETQKISVLDHINRFQYTTEKSDSFVMDMESFSHVSNNKDINPNSRITRSHSRKGSLRGGSGGGCIEKNINSDPHDRNTIAASSSSPRGPSMSEKASLVAVGTTDHSSNSQVHHQITITTTTGNLNASTESRCTIRRNSFKRSPSSWAIDPKRILFFFATFLVQMTVPSIDTSKPACSIPYQIKKITIAYLSEQSVIRCGESPFFFQG
ncbi:uncharacterized protein LOC110636630 isoform X2 [Hevea brasiliensis]|uniref:uncharacterized protein LOC110636630 isoform X2 n=1 Tax=Hevea brasiliensis TaxID=3981 RepID=UPI0025E4888F|nr:uncharacterized protein LOC110636630 isoform X2 [Hevea brasiliensis]